VGLLVVRLRIPGSRSLKDRRSVVRSLCDRLRARVGAAVAEVGGVWGPGAATGARGARSHQLAEIAAVVVSGEGRRVEEKLEQAERIVYQTADAEILECTRDIF